MQVSEFGLRTQSMFSFIATFLIVTLIGTLNETVACRDGSKPIDLPIVF
jgi:hypothetical protein